MHRQRRRATCLLGLTSLVLVGVATARAEEGAGPPRVVRAPAAVVVENELQLRAVARICGDQDLNVLIPGEIVLRETLTFPTGRGTVRLIGIGPHAGIRMAITVDTERRLARAKNGIEFHNARAVLRGLKISGYDWFGSAIKGHVTELLDISDCLFQDIGVSTLPPGDWPKEVASDYRNQCIAAHELREAHISVVNCRFANCALSKHNLSHCIYVSARSVLVTGNVFRGCGNAFGIGGPLPGATNNIFGNLVEDPQASPNRRGEDLEAYVSHLGPVDSTAFMFNTIHGSLGVPWTGRPGQGNHLIDYNDYQRATFGPYWAANTSTGTYLTIDDWRACGYDHHSLMAAPRPAADPKADAPPTPTP